MSSVAPKSVILVYDKQMSETTNALGKNRLRTLRKVLGQLGYAIVNEFKWERSKAPGYIEKIAKVESRFVISLVDTSHDPILRIVDFSGVPIPSIGVGDEAIDGFFRKLYRVGDTNAQKRRVLILLMGPGASSARSEFRTDTCDNIYRLASSQWITDQNKTLESDLKAAIQLVFDPWKQQEDTSYSCDEILDRLGIEISKFTYDFSERIKELLNDEIGFERSVQEVFFSVLTRVLKSEYPDVTKLLIAIHLLNAMRMARRLSSFTLEGEKFNCWVIMNDLPNDKTRGVKRIESASIFRFYDYIPFDIYHEKAVRDVVELSLGNSVCLLVDLKTNRIDSVLGRSSLQDNSNGLTEQIRGITSFGFHIRDDERVEVLDNQNISKLIWDGFKWKQSEVVSLDTVLKSGDSGFSLTEKSIGVISAAVDELLIGGYSSIFVIVHKLDKGKWRQVSDKSLRPDLLHPRGSFAPKHIDQMNASQLVTVLKLDGAHLLDEKGKLYQVCRNLSFQPGAWNVWTPDPLDEGSQSNLQNELLSSYVQKSQGSWLIDLKPSSSELLGNFVDIMRKPLSNQSFERNLLRHLNLVRASTTGFENSRKIAQNNDFELSAEKRGSAFNFQNDTNFSLFVKVSYPEASVTGLDCPGLFVSNDARFFYVDVSKIKEVQENLDSSQSDIAPLLSQSLDHWFRTGCVSGSGSSGTGSRAALEASKVLSNSLVVKISASGKLLIFKGGKPI